MEINKTSLIQLINIITGNTVRYLRMRTQGWFDDIEKRLRSILRERVFIIPLMITKIYLDMLI